MISFLDAIQCFPFHLIFAQGQPYMPPVPVASPGTSDNEDFFKERGDKCGRMVFLCYTRKPKTKRVWARTSGKFVKEDSYENNFQSGNLVK